MENIEQILKEADNFSKLVQKIEIENEASIKSKERIENTLEQLRKENAECREAYDIATHAIEILKGISDEQVEHAYAFLERNINNALERMFTTKTRKIKMREFLRDDKYPQLVFDLYVENNRVRSLASDSGHGIGQIVSLLSIISIIAITGARRLVVIDEVLSGLSVHNRQVMGEILQEFTTIGFQFIISEHIFIPKGSKVYVIEAPGEVSRIKEEYIAEESLYEQYEDKGDNGEDNYDAILANKPIKVFKEDEEVTM